ncbi:MAG: cobalamin B12-binding domain-containing protein [Chloroflexi bacterium]|nr:cobalamin B12-binding domain-containing protein [Chloroflexota bacterium]
MSKILLLRPPSPVARRPSHTSDVEWPPLGLASLAAFVRQSNYDYEVDIRDLVVEPLVLSPHLLESMQPDCIGISCMSRPNFQQVEGRIDTKSG